MSDQTHSNSRCNRFILCAADDISKLRMIDVERVLSTFSPRNSDGVSLKELADFIKQHRPELASEVDGVLDDINPM